MDRHDAPGVTAEAAYAVHDLDLRVEALHGCRCHTFWIDPVRGFVNCLVEASTLEQVIAMHTASHGMVPSLIQEVQPELVLAFVGRLTDLPPRGSASRVDSAFRVVMFTDLQGSTELTERLGDASARIHFRRHDSIVRDALVRHRGCEVKHTGDGFMASFAEPEDAVACAIDIQRSIRDHNARSESVQLHVRIGICAGEPIVEDEDLFGTAVQIASRICNLAAPDEVVGHADIRTLCAPPGECFRDGGARALKGFGDPVPVVSVEWRLADSPG